MNLKCPKCSSDATQKLSLVMNAGGTQEKASQLGLSYGANIALPVGTVVIAMVVALPIAMASPLFGLIAFVGIIYGGFALRKKLKKVAVTPYSNLSPDMKQNGFQCQRCANMFIPA